MEIEEKTIFEKAGEKEIYYLIKTNNEELYQKQYWRNQYLRHALVYDYDHIPAIFHHLGYIFYPEIESNYFKNMPYKEFLLTDYWMIIKKYIKMIFDYRCKECNSINKKLNVHHLTYKNHGKEHIFYYSDLVLLCEDCHNFMHKDLIYDN